MIFQELLLNVCHLFSNLFQIGKSHKNIPVILEQS